METYKGPITRSRSKQLQNLEVGESSEIETKEIQKIGDREERRNEILEN